MRAIGYRKASPELDHLETTMPEEVLRFIAENVRSNVRELEGALKRVLAYCRFNNTQVNVTTARAGSPPCT